MNRREFIQKSLIGGVGAAIGLRSSPSLLGSEGASNLSCDKDRLTILFLPIYDAFPEFCNREILLDTKTKMREDFQAAHIAYLRDYLEFLGKKANVKGTLQEKADFVFFANGPFKLYPRSWNPMMDWTLGSVLIAHFIYRIWERMEGSIEPVWGDFCFGFIAPIKLEGFVLDELLIPERLVKATGGAQYRIGSSDGWYVAHRKSPYVPADAGCFVGDWNMYQNVFKVVQNDKTLRTSNPNEFFFLWS